MHLRNEQKMPSIWTIVVNIYVSRKIRFVADLSEQIRECHYKLYQVILRDVTNLWREGKSWARWPLQFKSPHIVECQLNRLLSFHLSFYHIFSLLRTSSVLKSFIFRAQQNQLSIFLTLLFLSCYQIVHEPTCNFQICLQIIEMGIRLYKSLRDYHQKLF